MEYPNELKEKVGLWLQTAPHGSQKAIAQALKLSTRTLRSWEKRSCSNVKNVRGRKKLNISFKEKVTIAREWKRQGYTGSRPVIHALPALRVRVVREVIGELKMRQKKKLEAIKLNVRKHVRVTKAGVVVAMDGASTSRGSDYIVHRDRGSLSVNITKCSGNLNANDTLGLLKNLELQNKLPLVFCSDNGSPFCAHVVTEFLNKKYIVHLKNLPRVPQHNGSCENAVREFKDLLAHQKDFKKVTKILNENRLRQQLNWQTSQDFEENNFIQITEERRRDFYEKTKQSVESATNGIKNAYKKRKIERDEILKMMQMHSLIKITRGNQLRQIKAERIA